MRCYVCDGESYLEILNMDPAPVWTDVCDSHEERNFLPCILRQCERCGHVYQPVRDSLNNQLKEIYRSQHAPGVSSMGMGNWGLDRADRLFFDHVNLDGCKSVLEIGCGDGYLLKKLKSRGFEYLVGIEPSERIADLDDDINVFHEFLDTEVNIQHSFDLVFSIAVFEHIAEINDVLRFCTNVLADEGELYLVVPDCQRALETGDPGLFIHQHIHYFTNAMVRNLLARHNLSMTRSESINGNLLVFARRSHQSDSPIWETVCRYDEYQFMVQNRLSYLENLFNSRAVVVHGACNALNNIAAWTRGRYDLVDNDENKIGRTYWGMRVLHPDQVEFDSTEIIVVAPTEYFLEIRDDYLKRGFRGDIVDTGMPRLIG